MKGVLENLQRGVYKANNVGVKGSIDWIKDCQFSKSLNGTEKHRADDNVAKDLDTQVSLERRRIKR
jgi:hypothetical protein